MKKSLNLPILYLNMNNNLLKESLSLYERLNHPLARCVLVTKKQVIEDFSRRGAAKAYRDNWEGCRDLWKSDYRLRKERRTTSS